LYELCNNIDIIRFSLDTMLYKTKFIGGIEMKNCIPFSQSKLSDRNSWLYLLNAMKNVFYLVVAFTVLVNLNCSQDPASPELKDLNANSDKELLAPTNYADCCPWDRVRKYGFNMTNNCVAEHDKDWAKMAETAMQKCLDELNNSISSQFNDLCAQMSAICAQIAYYEQLKLKSQQTMQQLIVYFDHLFRQAENNRFLVHMLEAIFSQQKARYKREQESIQNKIDELNASYSGLMGDWQEMLNQSWVASEDCKDQVEQLLKDNNVSDCIKFTIYTLPYN
jgi:hypothetical protein